MVGVVVGKVYSLCQKTGNEPNANVVGFVRFAVQPGGTAGWASDNAGHAPPLRGRAGGEAGRRQAVGAVVWSLIPFIPLGLEAVARGAAHKRAAWVAI